MGDSGAAAAAGGRPGPLRRHAGILAALLLAAPGYFAWSLHDSMGQLGSDGGSYLMMAQHYAPYGSDDPVYAQAAAASRFPPLYPLLLAWTGGAAGVVQAHAVTSACLLLSLLALYAWLVREELPRGAGAALALGVAALPGSWMLGLLIQSEYLFAALSLLALYLLALHRAEGRPTALYGAALAVAAAMLTRAVGIALLPALLAAAWRGPRRQLAAATALALLPALAWRAAHPAPLDYGQVLRGVYGAGGWSAVRGQLAANLPALWDGLVRNFTPLPGLRPAGAVLGALGLAAALWRLLRLAPDGVYAAASLAILALWPFPEEAQRFMWVLLPVLLAQLALLLNRRASGGKHLRHAALALGCALLAVALPSIAAAAQRHRAAAASDIPDAASYVAWYGADAAQAGLTVGMEVSLINALRLMADYVPAADCVISTRPDLVNYFGRRRSVFPPLNSVPDERFMALIRASGCRYVFGLFSPNPGYPVPMHPLQRLEGSTEVIYNSTLAEADGRGRLLAVLARLRDAGPR